MNAPIIPPLSMEDRRTPAKVILPVRDTDRRRFWSKVDQSGADECWVWLGGSTAEGRGRFSLRQQTFFAPRVAFALTYGEPTALVCHACDNPACCNPSHLWDGTSGDNIRDAVNKGRWTGMDKTHCINGHEFTPENTRPLRPDRCAGQRTCRTCERERAAQRYARRKAEHLADCARRGVKPNPPGAQWGEANQRAKLTDAQVAQIRDIKGRKPQREIAAQFGVCTSTISAIHLGRIRAV